MKKIIILLLTLIVLCSCSSKTENEVNVDVQDENSVVDTYDENIDNNLEETSFEEYSLLVTAKAIKKRSTPSTESDDNLVGFAYMGDIYTVYEEMEDSDYIWRRISEDEWIADDGTWCEKLGNDSQTYPYIMPDEEKQGLLTTLNCNCFTSDSYENLFVCLNIFSDEKSLSDFGCDIYFDITDEPYINEDSNKSYKFNITHAIKTGDNNYDIYVTAVDNNGIIEDSVGCLRISNIHDIDEQELGNKYRHFDMIIIKNNNSVKNNNFNAIFGVKADYGHSGQVSL